MRIVVALLGAAMVSFALRDVFHTLFHPTGAGSIAENVPRGVWRVFRRIAQRKREWLSLAGPTALVAIILSWTVLNIVGWACIYWSILPGGFTNNPALARAPTAFTDVLYFSFITLATIGAADISPAPQWMRLLFPVEALIGFAIFTASVSWVLSLYPSIQRRQSAANEIGLLQDCDWQDHLALADAEPTYHAEVLTETKTMLVTVRSDFLQFPITYYFHALDERDNFATVAPYILEMAQRAERADSVAVRLAGAALRRAMRDTTTVLATHFLNMEKDSDPQQVLRRYLEDHLTTARTPT